MAFTITIPPPQAAVVDPKTGFLTLDGTRYWQEIAEEIVAQVNAAFEAQAAAAAAQAAADVAIGAAEDAADDAAAAQAAVDALVIPPTGAQSVSANTALTADVGTVVVDATGGAVAITLAPAATATGRVTVVKSDASGNAVNVVPAGTDTLNGGPGPVSLTLANERRDFDTDQGSQWFG